jgi:hypothetical protein
VPLSAEKNIIQSDSLKGHFHAKENYQINKGNAKRGISPCLKI